MKYIVYLTTNIINHKIYVGVHGTEDPYTWDFYYGNGIFKNKPSSYKHPSTPFHYAIVKYGFDAFRRSVIAVFDTEQEALDLEGEIVNEEFIKRSDTYNVTLGGGIPPLLNKVIYQYDDNGKFVRQWKSIHEAALANNTAESAIGQAVLHKRFSAGNYWANYLVDNLNLAEYSKYDPKIPIFLYNSFGEYVKSYESMSDGVKDLECTLNHIQRSIKTGVMTKGYYISTALMSVYTKPKNERLSGMVHQYSLDGNYIKSFNSLKEAEKQLNMKLSGVNSSIRMGEQYKGFLWLRGEKQDSVKPYDKPKCDAKKVGQYTMDGVLIKTFSTVREARQEFPNVSKVLKGHATHCHNFKFKYIE